MFNPTAANAAAATVDNPNAPINISSADTSAALEQLAQPSQHGASFEAILDAAIAPINAASNNLTTQLASSLQENEKTSGVFEPSELANIQQSTHRLVVAVTVVSKATNMAVKFVNELTHLS